MSSSSDVGSIHTIDRKTSLNATCSSIDDVYVELWEWTSRVGIDTLLPSDPLVFMLSMIVLELHEFGDEPTSFSSWKGWTERRLRFWVVENGNRRGDDAVMLVVVQWLEVVIFRGICGRLRRWRAVNICGASTLTDEFLCSVLESLFSV